MNARKNYFRSCFKENLMPLFFITLISLVYCLIFAVLYQPFRYYLDYDNYVTYYRTTLEYPVIVLGLLCYIVPVLQFKRFKKRRHLDLYYSVPVSRRELGATHFLVGLITVVVPYTLCYLENFIVMLTRPAGSYDFLPMIGHYFLCLLLGIFSYSLFSFVFNQANTVIDGCIFMVIYSFAFALLTEPIELLLRNTVNISNFGIEPVTLLGNATLYFENLIELKTVYGYSSFYDSYIQIWQIIAWMIVGVVALILFLLLFGRQPAEKTEEISDSWFGYKVLIPVLAALAMLIYSLPANDGGVITWFWVELITLIAYTVYRRGLRYKKSDIAVLLALCAFLPVYLL